MSIITKYILVLCKDSADGLDDTTIRAEAKCSINITESRKNICLSLHYNGSNSFLHANGLKIYQFKTKGSEIKVYPLCWANISNGFIAFNTNETGLHRYVYCFSVDYDTIDNSNILNIHNYLMKIKKT